MSDSVVTTAINARGVARVTFNRPQVNNAYNAELVQAASSAVDALATDEKTRVLVFSGNGKHFQAGADLAWIREVASKDDAFNIETSRRTAELVRSLNELNKPTLALIHGACIGGGTGIAAACDIVIASEDAFFAISEARWGLTAGIIVPQLNAAIGARNVRRYALTCERFDANRAKALGLVHEVCPTGALESTAAPIIDHLLHAAPQAAAETKRCVLECSNGLLDNDQLDTLTIAHAAKRQTPEAAEGLASFVEKRQPAWYR